MKFFVWLIRAMVFVVLLILALANTQDASLNLLANRAWTAPLILIGLAFFVVGLLAGALAVLPKLFRQRREIGRLRRELKVLRATQSTEPVVPIMPPMI
ncbi:MAG: LapA family protein [Janthinobacterium lividum]